MSRILSVLVLSVIVVVSYGQPQPSSNSRDSSETAYIVNPAKAEMRATTQDQEVLENNRSMTMATWASVWFGGFALILSLIAVWISARQWGRSHNQTREEMRARIYVTPENTLNGWNSDPGPAKSREPIPRHFTPYFKITNIGNTPAEDVGFHAEFF